MNWKSSNMSATVAVVGVIVLAAASRLIPHWPNVTPVMAMALAGGAALSTRRLAIAVPLLSMALSDVALGALLGWDYAFHATQWAVYGSMVAISLFGRLYANAPVWKTTFLGGSVAAVWFFLATNFAVWLNGGFYPMTAEGLAACYAAGLAFYRDNGNFMINGLVSTWAYTGLMLMLIRSRAITRQTAAVKI